MKYRLVSKVMPLISKLIDFGSSVVVESQDNDQVRGTIGTPAFLAPECVQGTGEAYSGKVKACTNRPKLSPALESRHLGCGDDTSSNAYWEGKCKLIVCFSDANSSPTVDSRSMMSSRLLGRSLSTLKRGKHTKKGTRNILPTVSYLDAPMATRLTSSQMP